MVDWHDPTEVARDGDVFSKLLFTLFGAYLWEVFMTSDFEWSLLTRRRRFRWPLVFFFFLCRYCMLLALVGLLTAMTVTTKINCRALYTFNSWTGNMAILCASTSLMLRSIALWERRRSIIIILGIPCLAHWALLYRGMFVVIAQWNPETRNCVVVQTIPSLLNTTFFFTMAFDFLILVCTAIALLGRHSARTDLWRLLFQDGLVYFLISFSTNCIPAVLNVLNLNIEMNVIATIPAATITSIAACRAVMRLLDFSAGELFIHSISGGVTSSNPPVITRHPLNRPEIRVTTEQITKAEFRLSESDTPYEETRPGITSFADLQMEKDEEPEVRPHKQEVSSQVGM